MLPLDPKLDPLVEILRLAYRRGLAIRREQEKEAAELLAKQMQDDDADSVVRAEKPNVQDGDAS